MLKVLPDKSRPVALLCDYSFFPTRKIPMTLQAYPVLKAAGYKRIYELRFWGTKDHPGMTKRDEIDKALGFEGSPQK